MSGIQKSSLLPLYCPLSTTGVFLVAPRTGLEHYLAKKSLEVTCRSLSIPERFTPPQKNSFWFLSGSIFYYIIIIFIILIL